MKEPARAASVEIEHARAPFRRDGFYRQTVSYAYPGGASVKPVNTVIVPAGRTDRHSRPTSQELRCADRATFDIACGRDCARCRVTPKRGVLLRAMRRGSTVVLVTVSPKWILIPAVLAVKERYRSALRLAASAQ